MEDRTFFLSADNVLATRDQCQVEELALALMQRPEMARARQIAGILWRNAMAWPARDQMDRFDNMIEEYLFHYAMRAANGDAQYPRVARFMTPPHRWFGRDVPGSRWAGDSPDFIYRIVPIAHGGRYELRVTPTCDDPPTVTYALMADSTAAPVTQGLLDSLDLVREDNGDIVITVDGNPAEGRPNHLQTQPGADHLLIRDALGDWLRQTPHAMRIRNLDEPQRGPLTEDTQAPLAARRLLEGFYYTYYCTQSGSGQAPNQLRQPLSSAPFGGMASQWGTKANISLADDEALVIKVNDAGALFRNAVLCDRFHMSVNYWDRTCSLNNTQMAPDEDGAYTLVVAHQDPGIHNWLDTGGLNWTIFGHRWQAFPGGEARETPAVSAHTVKFRDLATSLPPGVRTIDDTGRRAQLAERRAGFDLRFRDC